MREDLSTENWYHVASYLGFYDILALASSNKHKNTCFSDNLFWEHFLHRHLTLACDRDINCQVTNAKSIFKGLLQTMVMRRYWNVIGSVFETSSRDRQEEGPGNTVTPSPCFQILGMGRMRNDEFLGAYAQSYCGCMGGSNSCYWSSGPSPTPNRNEYISYHMKPGASFIVGFTVTPYQAFMHPNSPVYGPPRVCIQLIKPSAATIDEAGNMMHQTTTTSGGTIGSDGNDFSIRFRSVSELEENVCYQSEDFDVENSFTQQTFSLPTPVLAIGMQVRFVFRGMYQRQLLGENMLEDYYLCISHCTVLAAALDAQFGSFYVVHVPHGHSRSHYNNSSNSEGNYSLHYSSAQQQQEGIAEVAAAAPAHNTTADEAGLDEFPTFCVEFLARHSPAAQDACAADSELEQLLEEIEDGQEQEQEQDAESESKCTVN